MKLFTRYFRINLLATLAIFLLASIAYYFLLWYVMLYQVDEDLKIEQREIENYVSRYNRAPEAVSVKDQQMSNEPAAVKERVHSFQTIHSPDASEKEDFRQISFTLPAGNRWMLFKVSKSLEGMQHMNRSIIGISLATIVLILLVSLLINRWLIQRLWEPFYNTLSGIKQYRIGEKKNVRFEPVSIDEFQLLNTTIDQFIREAEKEFTMLKEFTENASHELQTPLAIVRSKLDVLIQDENLSETQGRAAETAYAAIQKMTRLNQSLLLLSKIENRQFDETTEIDIKDLLEEKLRDYREIWESKHIHVHAHLETTSVVMNIQLADILLNNLFSNAIRHTMEGQLIELSLKNRQFDLSNTAVNGALDPEKLFKRFSKGGQSTDQHGLGLSIVEQICSVSGLKSSYRYSNGKHVFSVVF